MDFQRRGSQSGEGSSSDCEGDDLHIPAHHLQPKGVVSDEMSSENPNLGGPSGGVSWAIALHGGAGNIKNDGAAVNTRIDHLSEVLTRGIQMVERGAPAMDVAENVVYVPFWRRLGSVW